MRKELSDRLDSIEIQLDLIMLALTAPDRALRDGCLNKYREFRDGQEMERKKDEPRQEEPCSPS